MSCPNRVLGQRRTVRASEAAGWPSFRTWLSSGVGSDRSDRPGWGLEPRTLHYSRSRSGGCTNQPSRHSAQSPCRSEIEECQPCQGFKALSGFQYWLKHPSGKLGGNNLIRRLSFYTRNRLREQNCQIENCLWHIHSTHQTTEILCLMNIIFKWMS